MRTFLAVVVLVTSSWQTQAQTLEQQLQDEPYAQLATAASKDGDAKRGAILFFQSHMACWKCHVSDDPTKQLGPELSKLGKDASDVHLVESVLAPSKVIRKGFETVAVVTRDGKAITGLIAEEKRETLTLRDPGQPGKLVTIAKGEIDERTTLPTSLMSVGQVNQLGSRQQFLDLVKYLIEIRDGGPQRALELKPDPALTAAAPLPEYESKLDHAALIKRWGKDSLTRGESIYLRVCANCHGTHDMPGSLPMSLKFAEGKFKNGSDPFSMYQTLTRGFGFMVPQHWMVPKQKYDVIHYIREAYLKPRNPSQFVPVDETYLARLPKGSTLGPEPSNIEPWVVMDYGPYLINSYEIPALDVSTRSQALPGNARAGGSASSNEATRTAKGREAEPRPLASQGGALERVEGPNFAYKGIAMRLDRGAGGVSRGRNWAMFDHDTFRMAAAWSGTGFIDWNGIHFNGRHQIHPAIVGKVLAVNPPGPGWAHPETGSFEDPRLRGRDGRAYGPLPREWARYRGLYQTPDRTIVSYSIGKTDVLESYDLVSEPKQPDLVVRSLTVGPREKPLTMLVATFPRSSGGSPETSSTELGNEIYIPPFDARQSDARGRVAPQLGGESRSDSPTTDGLDFGGSLKVDIDNSSDFDFTNRSYSIVAKTKTRGDGTLVAQTPKEGKWVPDGKTFFLRGGRPTFDVGWVGAVQSNKRVDDGEWHVVAMSWEHSTGNVAFIVDGKAAGSGNIKPKAHNKDLVLRIGATSNNFPEQSGFLGTIESVVLLDGVIEPTRATDEGLTKTLAQPADAQPAVRGAWRFAADSKGEVADVSASKLKHVGRISGDSAAGATAPSGLVIGVIRSAGGSPATSSGATPATNKDKSKDSQAGRLHYEKNGQVLLTLPAGKESLDFSVWFAEAADVKSDDKKMNDKNNKTVDDSSSFSRSFFRHSPAFAPATIKSRIEQSGLVPLTPDPSHPTPEAVPTGVRGEITTGGRSTVVPVLATNVVLGKDDGPFAVDVLTPPSSNPWNAQTRLTGFDFFKDSDKAAVCSWDGDVWLVSGLTTGTKLSWQRIATGLFQPLGLKVVEGGFHGNGTNGTTGTNGAGTNGAGANASPIAPNTSVSSVPLVPRNEINRHTTEAIYVTCRDQIVILRDLNGDGVTDFYENFNNDAQVTEHFHEFAMGLQTDAEGNFYYAKSGRHALAAVVPHHGTLLKVSKDGSKTEILATGFRAANGVCLNPDGSFIVTDQEGFWNPKNRINWVTLRKDGKPNFYGNMFGYHDVTDSSDEAMVPPLCWITNSFDRSPAELLWVTSDKWGPLKGSLLNLSYGYGKVFVVPHEDVPVIKTTNKDDPRFEGMKQGGMSELPLPIFPTGIMRGRFHPQDGQLYACGMFAWAGNATQPGGFYRIRYTGKPAFAPIGLQARKNELIVTLTDAVDPVSVTTDNIAVNVWSLKRTANYGSKHYDEKRLNVTAAKLDADGKTLRLTIPDLAPTWGMEIKLALKTPSGQAVNRTIHNTIHRVAE